MPIRRRPSGTFRAVLTALPAIALLTVPHTAVANDAGRDDPAAANSLPVVPDGAVGDLADALRLAYRAHPGLLAQRAQMRGAGQRLPQARAAYGPRLDFELAYGYQRDNFEQPGGSYVARQGWSSTAAAILTQPLLTFGRNAAGERAAMARIDYQQAALRSNGQQVLFNAIRAFSGLMRDRNALAIFRDDLALLEREFHDNSARFAKREVTASDVQQVESRVELARAQLAAAERAVASGEAAFRSTIGVPAGLLALPAPLPVPVASVEDALAHGELHNPVVLAARARERISRAERDAARADLLPRLDLRGRAEYGTLSPYSNALRQTELRGQVVLSGPIFESGLRHARLAEADAANDADWRLIDEAIRENRADIAAGWAEWQTLNASIEPLRRAADAARRAFDGALLQEKAGLRSTLDVLSLARELLTARNSYNAAQADAFVAQARVLATIGALDRATLLADEPAADGEEDLPAPRSAVPLLPLVTPLVRAFDTVGAPRAADRPSRDTVAAPRP